MDKKYSLILSFLITALLFSSLYFLSLNSPAKDRKSVIVARVIDGDTIESSDGSIIRLLNINSPEKGTKNSELSKLYLSKLVNSSVELEIEGKDKYSRILARIYTPVYINKELVSQGLASKFLVSQSELKDFAKAEEEAINSEKGIWKHSDYYGCFSTQINKYEDYVLIRNTCGNINMLGWTLKDESRKIYIFRNISIGKLTLSSSLGKDNSTNLFWNSKTSIWNNDRDTLYLFDREGGIAHHESYGY